MIRPTSQPPISSIGSRRRAGGAGAVAATAIEAGGGLGQRSGGSAEASPARVPDARLVLEALADGADAILRHHLGARVEIGGGDAAIDLQVELRHRPEALQEGLLPERAAEGATLDSFELLRPEVVAVGADLAFHLLL